MFGKMTKLNIKALSHEISSLNLLMDKQLKLNDKVGINMDSLMANQELLFRLIKKLADCFQLEYMDGKYVSKRHDAKPKRH